MISLYVFDMDGTLIDSGEDIADCVNATLSHFGYFNVPTQELISFTGDGARALIIRALKSSTRGKFDETTESGKRKTEEILAWYLSYYGEHPVTKTKTYAGIPELLKVLSKKGKKCALLTNKPEHVARKILDIFGIAGYFSAVVCPESGVRKPDPRALEMTVRKINESCGTKFGKENTVMIGDSAVDIKCGKSFGCMTIACRDGLGKREELLAEKPDVVFAVASEVEKFIDLLSSENGATEIQKSAMENNVPIMQDEGSDFICDFIWKTGAREILEIGSAIGYSAIKFARTAPETRVTTIEIDDERFESARKNIDAAGLSGRIEIIHADALEYEIGDRKFDVIFIDAAKAQYERFFEKYKANLSEGGAIISDNLEFHGMVADPSLTRNHSTLQLVKKIRRYVEFLKANEEFTTEFISLGDGISISRRRKISS